MASALHELRRRAHGKLAHAEELDLTRKGLEQSSHRLIAGHRADRVDSWLAARNSPAWLLDATAGIGGDAVALAALEHGQLVAADADPAVAAALAHNLRVAGQASARVLVQRAESPALRADFVLLDPDRRAEGQRRGDPEHWSPTWSDVLVRIAEAEAGCVKLAPATDVDRLPLPKGLPAHFEWISLGGELKEVALWTGALAEPGARHVTAIEKGGTVHGWSGLPLETDPLSPENAARVRWIADPDPGLIRSGLLGALAEAEGLSPLAGSIAYLGGDHPPTSPFLRAYEVLGSEPLDPRRVRALLRAEGIGPVTVKKRGHPDDASTLAHRFKGKGKARGLLLIARLEEGHRAYLVRQHPGKRTAGVQE